MKRDFRNNFHLPPRAKDDELLRRIDENFSIRHQWRAPRLSIGFINPQWLPCLIVEAMDLAPEVGGVEQAVADRNAGDAALEAFVGPDAAGVGDVAGFRRVDAIQNPSAAAVHGVLADRAIDATFVK